MVTRRNSPTPESICRKHPSAKLLAVCDGQQRIGTIILLDRTYHSFNVEDRPLGTFRRLKDASSAVNNHASCLQQSGG
jgi:hypothetical protein